MRMGEGSDSEAASCLLSAHSMITSMVFIIIIRTSSTSSSGIRGSTTFWLPPLHRAPAGTGVGAGPVQAAGNWVLRVWNIFPMYWWNVCRPYGSDWSTSSFACPPPSTLTSAAFRG